MTKKRRNGGISRKGRGMVKPVRCHNCSRCVPKDKAIKRVRSVALIEAAGIKDLSEACVYPEMIVPKVFVHLACCISCAIHSKTVRARSAVDRRNRLPPPRPVFKDGKRIHPAVIAAFEAKHGPGAKYPTGPRDIKA